MLYRYDVGAKSMSPVNNIEFLFIKSFKQEQVIYIILIILVQTHPRPQGLAGTRDPLKALE